LHVNNDIITRHSASNPNKSYASKECYDAIQPKSAGSYCDLAGKGWSNLQKEVGLRRDLVKTKKNPEPVEKRDSWDNSISGGK